MQESINKNLYKIFLSVLKFTPITLGIIQTLCTILNILSINTSILTYIGGSSIMFLVLLYIMSYVFKFCYLYRIPLNYITIIGLIKILSGSLELSEYAIEIFRIHISITGLFIVTFIYYMYKNRKSKKVDYIKELCQRYCDC